ncbi:hypothetical protein V6N11_036395 [Hibiscus sabdariffa]|uniref:Uncharacterized protein n=2 Tax=Hibiscus sabdariffa TaxID=183260 RepID=A0ABR1ZJE2_9ROSI
MFIWRYDNTGVYSPKSGYKCLIEDAVLQHSSVNGPVCGVIKGFYNSLWGINVPAKCKIFFWRLLNNFIPNFSNLMQRRLQVRNCCPMCEEGADSTEHFIIYCSWTRQVLDDLNLSFPLMLQSLDYKQAVIQYYMQIDEQGKMKLVLTYWSLWYARNQLIHEGSPLSKHKSIAFIRSLYAELEALNNSPSNHLVAHHGVWSTPAANIIKLNFDAHFMSVINKSVSGIIARNSLGQIMGACAYPHTSIADPFIAEAKACEMAVSFAIDLGFRQIQVEGDSLSIIKKLNSIIADKSIISPIVNDIISMRDSFELITFAHVGRLGNEAAHELVRYAAQLDLPRFWFGTVPEVVECAVQRDLAP